MPTTIETRPMRFGEALAAAFMGGAPAMAAPNAPAGAASESGCIEPATPETLREAGEGGRAVIAARKEFKEELRGGGRTFADALEEARSDPALRGMRVRDIVGALTGKDARAAGAMLAESGVSVGRKVTGLGWRQEAALMAAIDGVRLEGRREKVRGW